MPEREASARRSLWRGLVAYSVLLLGDLALLYVFAAAGVEGFGYVSLAVLALIGLLLAYQLWTHVRDLGSPAMESEGQILRKWSRADLIIAWQAYYISIGRRVFRIEPGDYVMLDEGMHAHVVHFPRTLNVISVEQIRVVAKSEPADQPS
jgi:hypothetical protein